jgi:hypothetical protein
MLTDDVIDPAGNVWAASNRDSPEAAVYHKVVHRISTLGGGSGFTLIYGVGTSEGSMNGPGRAKTE